MPETPTFVFDDDGRAYAYLDGKIVAAADDADQLEQKIAYGGEYDPGNSNFDSAAMADGPLESLEPDMGGGCPACGGNGTCAACNGTGQDTGQGPIGDEADPLPGSAHSIIPGDDLPPRATHVETPNGLKGQILGKVKGLWGEQVTVRLENGRIAKFDVSDDCKFTTEKTASTSSPVEALQERLDAIPDGTKTGLVSRLAELKKLKDEASGLIRTHQSSYTESTKLHNIVVLADHEVREVTDALSALEDAEPFAPPAPFSTEVVEQESLGGGDSSWLDDTLAEMVAEAEATDFDQMMEESPEVIVAEMETPALEDAEGVRDRAVAHVRSKTAGIEREAVEEFTKAFVARVEEVRKTELSNRQADVETQTKEASYEDDGRDEGLFF